MKNEQPLVETQARTISLAFHIFKAGAVLVYKGRSRVISNVVLKGRDLFVHLDGDIAPVDSRLLNVQYTEFRLKLFEGRTPL